MHIETGKIIEPGMLEKLVKENPEEAKNYIEMKIPPTPQQMAKRPPTVGRNQPCPCGSGKKFKKCCYMKEFMNEKKKS